MAQQKVRIRIGVVLTILAVAALLAGPALTYGIDVPIAGGSSGTTSQVTSTVQGVVDTTQQTVSTTVTNAQSTVPTTVQQAPAAVQQTVSAPAASTPAAPAPATTRKQAVTTTVSAVRNKVASLHRARTTRPAASSPTAGALASVQAPASAVRSRVQSATGRKSLPLAAAPGKQPGTSRPAASNCSLPLLDNLPASLDLSALLSVLCTATDLLNPSSGQAAESPLPELSLSNVLGVTVANLSALRARALRPLALPHSLDRQLIDGASAAAAAAPSGRVVPGGFASAGARGQSTITPAFAGQTATTAEARRAAEESAGGHGVFSKPVDASEALGLVLMIDAIVLGLLLLYQAARRWVVPRFA